MLLSFVSRQAAVLAEVPAKTSIQSRLFKQVTSGPQLNEGSRSVQVEIPGFKVALSDCMAFWPRLDLRSAFRLLGVITGERLGRSV